MNRAYIGKLMELAEQDRNVLHLLADSGTGYDEMFRRNLPEQIYNFGIGEENMVAAAAGMAAAGKKPFVFTAGAFLAYRALEFIRDDVCFQNLNVKIVGMGSGLSWSSLGPTHHTTEDIAVLRALPNLVILSPATPKQVIECVQKAYEHIGPVYIRLGMNHEKEFFFDDYTLDSTYSDVMMDGNEMAVFTTGSILEEVYDACQKLRNEGIGVRLVNVARLKPFPEVEVVNAARKIGKIVTIEEHNIHGGLAGIIAEINSFKNLGAQITPIGIDDTFAIGYGSYACVRKENGLDADSIYYKIRKELCCE